LGGVADILAVLPHAYKARIQEVFSGHERKLLIVPSTPLLEEFGSGHEWDANAALILALGRIARCCGTLVT